MKRLIVTILVTLFITGCSNNVNNIENDYYNQSQSYAKSLYELTEGQQVTLNFYDDISNFLDKPTTTEDEKKIKSLLLELHNLSSLYLAQETLHKNEAKKTKQRIETIINTLENEYGMSIK